MYGNIDPDWEFYDQLVDLIVAKGSVGGAKGYFCAIVDENEGLKINIEQIQVPQAWWCEFLKAQTEFSNEENETDETDSKKNVSDLKIVA